MAKAMIDFRKFMVEAAEDVSQDATDKANDVTGGAESGNDDGAQNKDTKEIMIPKNRFDEINGKYKDALTQLDKLSKAQEKADKKSKEEQGKFEELYKSANTELETMKGEHGKTTERVASLEAVINGLLEAELKTIPKDMQDLIPGNMTPEQKLEWLSNAKAKGLFKAQTKKDEPLGQSTNPSGAQTTDLNKLSPMQLLRAGYGQK